MATEVPVDPRDIPPLPTKLCKIDYVLEFDEEELMVKCEGIQKQLDKKEEANENRTPVDFNPDEVPEGVPPPFIPRKMYYAFLFNAKTKKTYYVFSNSFYHGFRFSAFFLETKSGLDDNEIITLIKREMQPILKTELPTTVERLVKENVVNLTKEQLDHIAVQIINNMALNGQSLTYSPILADIKILKDGAVVPIEMIVENGVSTGKVTLNGEYTIQIKAKA